MQTFLRLRLLFALVVCLTLGCLGMSDRTVEVSDKPNNEIVTVYVVNYPLMYFAERIGDQYVRVVFPVPLGEDPAFWIPDSETIAACQQADLILLNGASYAGWTKTVSLPASKLVDTSVSFAHRYIEIEDVSVHVHGLAGEHVHAGTACTTWLDPRLALAQAESIKQALQRLRPCREDDFQRNFAALESDLNELDVELHAAVQGKTDCPLLFSHPVYQYLQRRYNLNAESVHWEPDAVPSETMWKEFEVVIARHPAAWIVWERAPIEENIKRLEELSVKSTVYDLCGNVPDVGDFLSVMKQNVENLTKVLAE